MKNLAFILPLPVCFFFSLWLQLGGWSVSGPWNETDFNATLSTLMRDYATFPFFNVYVGKHPTNASAEMTGRYIQVHLVYSYATDTWRCFDAVAPPSDRSARPVDPDRVEQRDRDVSSYKGGWFNATPACLHVAILTHSCSSSSHRRCVLSSLRAIGTWRCWGPRRAAA